MVGVYYGVQVFLRGLVRMMVNDCVGMEGSVLHYGRGRYVDQIVYVDQMFYADQEA